MWRCSIRAAVLPQPWLTSLVRKNLAAPEEVHCGRCSRRTKQAGEVAGPGSLEGSCVAPRLPNERAHHPVQGMAAQAYANRDFKETVQLLTDLISREPDSPRWYEMRAQVRFSRRKPYAL